MLLHQSNANLERALTINVDKTIFEPSPYILALKTDYWYCFFVQLVQLCTEATLNTLKPLELFSHFFYWNSLNLKIILLISREASKDTDTCLCLQTCKPQSGLWGSGLGFAYLLGNITYFDSCTASKYGKDDRNYQCSLFSILVFFFQKRSNVVIYILYLVLNLNAWLPNSIIFCQNYNQIYFFLSACTHWGQWSPL